jgi:hypothetical protein
VEEVGAVNAVGGLREELVGGREVGKSQVSDGGQVWRRR